MSSDFAIRAESLSKAYKLYSKPIDMLRELLTLRSHHELFWALRDVTFELRQGEMVAFIGRNGAGKSTLLKIIAGTLDQTSGTFEVNGRVASILELGTGFNPEYTGLENVRLGGLCLGLSKHEVEEKLDWIIDFSELRQFINRPFKTYSSGMQARLTFSTAACIEPEVLIVDEALSVGDLKFQVKCFDRLKEFRKNGGTILLVSHDLNTVNTLCNKAYWIEKGHVIAEGEPRTVTAAYYKALFDNGHSENVSQSQQQDCDESISRETAGPDKSVFDSLLRFPPPPDLSLLTEVIRRPVDFGDGKARIISYGVYDLNGNPVQMTRHDEMYLINMRVAAMKDLTQYRIGYLLRDSFGRFIYGTGSHTMRVSLPKLKSGEIIDFYFKVKVPRVNYPYLISIGIAASEEHFFDFRQDCIVMSSETDAFAFGDSCVHIETELLTGNSWHMQNV